MSSSVDNIRIEPINVTWEIEEQTRITCVADVSSSLQSKWLGFQASDGVKYYAWFNVATLGVDPAIAGRTGAAVAIAANASASTVATALAAAIAGIAAGAKFEASASSALVVMTNIDPADVEKTFDGTAATGFTFAQSQQGGSLDTGYIQGDVKSAFEVMTQEIKSHQTGTTLLAELRTGTGATISLTMEETDVPRIKEVFATVSGGAYTPPGGTELFGWGTNQQGTNTVIQARRLVFHPVTAGTDRSRDLCFWKALPNPKTLVYSGENPNTIEVEYKTYLDPSKDSTIQHWSMGDWTQLIPGA